MGTLPRQIDEEVNSASDGHYQSRPSRKESPSKTRIYTSVLVDNIPTGTSNWRKLSANLLAGSSLLTFRAEVPLMQCGCVQLRNYTAPVACGGLTALSGCSQDIDRQVGQVRARRNCPTAKPDCVPCMPTAATADDLEAGDYRVTPSARRRKGPLCIA